MPYSEACRIKRAAASRAWREANKEHRAAYGRAYRQANREQVAAYQRAYEEANKDHIADVKRAWSEANKDRRTEQLRIWKAENKQRVVAAERAWRTENRAAKRALIAQRRAAVLARTPCWANRSAINAIYAKALRLSQETGIAHHVDHMIPLQGKLVSGLHVETNLQILTATANHQKFNRFQPDL